MIVELLVTAIGAWLSQAPAASAPAWTIDVASPVQAIAPAVNGRCVAVVTGNDLLMVNDAGNVAWKTPLAEAVNARGHQPSVAASPTCDWAAVFTQSGRVQLLSSNRPPIVAAFGDPAVAIDSSTFTPRSMSIGPDGSTLLMGTERDWLVLVTRTGTVTTREIGEAGMPITAEFLSDGTRIVVTGLWTTGVMKLDGTWVWHKKADHFQISAARDLSRFAAYFVTAHGPAGGDVFILDSKGNATWSLKAWEPGAAIAPDGAFVAYVTIPGGAFPPPDAPKMLFVTDTAGRTTAECQIRGYLEFITQDGCVLVHERDRDDGPYDLVARDKALKEIWRLRADVLPYTQTKYSPSLVLAWRNRSLVAYRMPSCR